MEKLVPNLLIAVFYSLLLLFSWIFIVREKTQPTCPFQTMRSETYLLAANKEKNSFTIKIPEIEEALELQVNKEYSLFRSNISFNVVGNKAKLMAPEQKNQLYSYLAEAYTTTSTNSFSLSLYNVKSIQKTANTLDLTLTNIFSQEKEAKVQLHYENQEEAVKLLTRVQEYMSANSFSNFESTIKPLLDFYASNNEKDKAINNLILKLRNYASMNAYLNNFNNLSSCSELQNVLDFTMKRQSLLDKHIEKVVEQETEMQKFYFFVSKSIEGAQNILSHCKNEEYSETVKALIGHIAADRGKIGVNFGNTAKFFLDKHNSNILLSGDIAACKDTVATNEFFLYRLAFILERVIN